MNNHFHLKLCVLGMSAAMIMGCKQNAEEIQVEQPPIVVSVFTAQHQPIHLIENLPARVAAYRIAEIRLVLLCVCLIEAILVWML